MPFLEECTQQKSVSAEMVMTNLQMDALLAINVVSYSRGLNLRLGTALLERLEEGYFGDISN
jgi:hypothetical protein